MLFSEFQKGTGCKDNAFNYLVYTHLEAIYMESDVLTKSDIYNIAKKMVDNRLSPAALEFNAHLEEEIEANNALIRYYEWELEAGLESSCEYATQRIKSLKLLNKSLKSCFYK